MTKTNSLAVDNVIFDTLQSENTKVNQFQATATPQIATRLGEIHAAYPGLTLGVKLAMAKSGMTNQTIDKIYPQASSVSLVQATEPPKQKSWYERNITDKIKTGSRYGFAALNLPLDIIQGTAAQAFDNNSSIDGWFASTDLGSLIKNDTQAGTGYFMGGKARELQAQRARDYRGTIGGHAWTIGRGLASTVFQPDTMGFNLMSGVFDAATALAVPSVPGASQAKDVILAAEEAGKGGALISGAARAIESVGKGSTVINATKMTAKEIEDARKFVTAAKPLSSNKFVELTNKFRKSISDFSDDDVLAVQRYTGGDFHYKAVQDELRSGNASKYLKPKEYAEVQQVITGLDNLMAKAPSIEEPFVTYRAITGQPGADFIAGYKNTKIGDVITEKGFSSTSANKSYATTRAAKYGQNGVVLEIVNPPGTRGLFTYGVRGELTDISKNIEQEFLLPRGTQFRVVSKTDNLIKVEVVNNVRVNDLDNARKGILVGSQVDFEKANHWFATAHAQRVVDRTAQTNDFAGVWDLYGRKIEPQLAMDLAKESDPNKVRLMLLDQLGTHKGLVDTGDIKGGKKVYMSLANRDKFISQLPLGDKISRAYAYVPNRSFNLMKAESPADQIKHLDTIDRMLKLSLVEPTQARSMLNQAASVMLEKNPNKIEAFTNRFDEVMRKSSSGFKETGQKTADLSTLTNHQNAFDRNFNVGQRVTTDSGEAAYITKIDRKAKTAELQVGTESVHREIVDAVFDGVKKLRDAQARFSVDETSDIQDWGSYNKMHGLSPVAGNDVTWAGPGLTSEFAQHDYYIPDVRQLRRLTASKPINWVIAKQGVVGDPNLKALVQAGQLRAPFSLITSIQEDVWRPIVTLTAGNFVRNTVDSQLMIALSGKRVSSIIRHPFEYLSLTNKRLKTTDLFGRGFDAEVSANQLSDAQEAFKFITTEALNSRYKDPVTAWRKATRLGNFTVRDKTIDSASEYIRGHADEIGKLNSDWLARTLANKTNGDVTPQDILDMIKRGDPDAKKWFDTMSQYYKDGRQTYNKVTGEWDRIPTDLKNDQNLIAHISEVQSRLDYVTGKHPELYNIIAQGKVQELNISADLIEKGKVAVGERVLYKQGKRRLAQGEITAINKASGEITVRPFAFVDGEATPDLVKRLGHQSIYGDPNMPKRVVAEMIDPRTPESTTLKDSMSRLTELFHGKLYNTPIAKLERSPVFRELYYGWVNKLADSLDKPSIDQIINDVTRRATASGKRPELMVGKETWTKLQDLQSGARKSYGTITAAELNAFASGQAIDDTMKMFYNAVDRRNGVDAMRIVSPFAQQWAEFIGRMGKLAFDPINASGPNIVPDINVLRKGQLIVHGATTGDPDQNGRGFVYKDPQSGQWSFTFPLSGQLTKALFGVESPINAAVKGIGQGLDWKPGLGPMATWAVSKLLPDSPSTDTIRHILLPYGERGALTEALRPTWLNKVLDGMTGNEGSKVFMNTVVETMQALAATGNYNTSDSNDRERLMNDAKTKARYLSVLRGLTQFTGPASGSYDPKIHAKGGDVYTSALAQTFREMQNKDYDTAVVNFINTFGEDAFVYMGNKTKAMYGGLDASKQFGDFERQNASLFTQFKDVAGFFGPVGTDFDMTVYQRQLNTGKRKKLTPEETLAAAEQTIGMAFYRQMRAQFPDSMDSGQREYMSQYRNMLNAKYPGYAQMTYDPNKVPKQIESLVKAAARPDLDNNQVAQGVRYYSQIRNQALVEASNRGHNSLTAKSDQDLRDYLASYARAVTEKYPDFGRVYDRLLSKEVEQ